MASGLSVGRPWRPGLSGRALVWGEGMQDGTKGGKSWVATGFLMERDNGKSGISGSGLCGIGSGLGGIESGLGVTWAGWAGSTGGGGSGVPGRRSGVHGGSCDGGWEAARGLQKARKAGRIVGSDRREELNFQYRLAVLLEAREGRTARPAVSSRSR